MYDAGFINGEVYLNGTFYQKNIYIEGGKIVEITELEKAAEKVTDCEGMKILPGFIDPHVHLELDLGAFSSVDNFYSGSRAAAFGGVTTLLDFLAPIGTSSEYEAAFEKRMKEAEKSNIDYSFHLTFGNFKDVNEVKELLKKASEDGITSVKIFTTYSDSDRKCSDGIIEEVLLSNLLLMAHCENDELVQSDYKDVATFEKSRPVLAERTAVIKLCEMATSTKGKLYVVHTSAGSTVEMVKKRFKGEIGHHIFLESCPQYFYLTEKDFYGENGRLFLLAPPLRSEIEKEKLNDHFEFIRTIGTDHCPFMKADKFKYPGANQVPKGLGSIQYSFLLMYGLFGYPVIDRFTVNPARLFGLKDKGAIEVGKDADLVIFDSNGETLITSGESACDYSPYEGLRLKGRIKSTVLRGEFLVKDGVFIGKKGCYIRREVE